MDVRRAASGQACKSSSCKCHGGGGRLGLPAERRKGAVVQRRGGLTGTRGPGFLARLTQSGHFSRHPFPGKQMSFLPCGAWERPGSGMTGGGTPARGTPGDLRCPGDSPPQPPNAGGRTEEEGRPRGPQLPSPPSPGTWSPLRHLGLGMGGHPLGVPWGLGGVTAHTPCDGPTREQAGTSTASKRSDRRWVPWRVRSGGWVPCQSLGVA